jgi:hypothetical protein
MRQIGRIERLQVQLDNLKKGPKPEQVYDPSPLRVVPALRVSSAGVIGLLDGQEMLDVHHADHPHSRDGGGSGLSFNFRSHYDSMRGRFGPGLELGCGGENILIAAEASFALPELVDGLIIENDAGARLHLDQIQVAHPCRAFSRYALGQSAEITNERLKETLQFLDGGARGFYCECIGEPIIVRPGDPVFIPD